MLLALLGDSEKWAGNGKVVLVTGPPGPQKQWACGPVPRLVPLNHPEREYFLELPYSPLRPRQIPKQAPIILGGEERAPSRE